MSQCLIAHMKLTNMQAAVAHQKCLLFMSHCGGRACFGVKWSIHGLSFRVLHLSNAISLEVCAIMRSRSSRRHFGSCLRSEVDK